MNNERKIPQCMHCGSEDVSLDATAMWDTAAQAWVLNDTHEQSPAFCGTCGGDTSLVWVDAPTSGQPDAPKLLILCTIEEDATYRSGVIVPAGDRDAALTLLGMVAMMRFHDAPSFAVIESDSIPADGVFPSTTAVLGPDVVPWAWE